MGERVHLQASSLCGDKPIWGWFIGCTLKFPTRGPRVLGCLPITLNPRDTNPGHWVCPTREKMGLLVDPGPRCEHRGVLTWY